MEKSGNAIPCKYVFTSSTIPIFIGICIALITFTELKFGLHFPSFVSSQRNFASLCQSPLRMKAFHDNYDKLGPYYYGPGRAKTCLMLYANKGADQPAHLCSLISAFVVHSLDSIISLVSRSEISRF